MIKTKYQTITSNYSVDLPEAFKLTKNFKLSELANTKGDPKKDQYLITEYSMRFNELLQQFRDWYGLPINPTSGYRQKEYNKIIGGSENSMHLYACACDFVDMGSEKDKKMISNWLRILNENRVIGSVNIYNNSRHFRYHIGAFTDVFQGKTKNNLLVYTNYEHYLELIDFYGPLGVGVYYYGDL